MKRLNCQYQYVMLCFHVNEVEYFYYITSSKPTFRFLRCSWSFYKLLITTSIMYAYASQFKLVNWTCHQIRWNQNIDTQRILFVAKICSFNFIIWWVCKQKFNDTTTQPTTDILFYIIYIGCGFAFYVVLNRWCFP